MYKLFFLLIQLRFLLAPGIGDFTEKSTFYSANPSSGTDAVGAIESFNGWLMSLLGYAGVIIMAIAIVKLVIALQQADASQKMQASLMFGLGTAFIVSDTILKAINLKENASNPKQVVLELTDTIGVLIKYVAIFLIAIAFVQMILSFINQDATQKVQASKEMVIAYILYFIQSTLTTIATNALLVNDGSSHSIQNITAAVISVIIVVARFIGVVMGVYGILMLIMALKDQDSGAIQQGAILIAVGIVLAFIGTVFTALGINIKPYTTAPSGDQAKTTSQLVFDTIKYLRT